MTNEQIIEFLRKTPAFHVATTDDRNRPHVRPFSFIMEWNGKLTFTTGKGKEIYRQLQGNPYIEVCSFDHVKGEWIRISGKVTFTDDISAREKVFEVMPQLKSIYDSPSNPELTCFYIESGESALFSYGSMNAPVEITNL